MNVARKGADVLLFQLVLLRRQLASNIAVFSFMTPLFGVSFGVPILDEPLSLNCIAGAARVLLGIVLLGNHVWVSRGLSLWRYAER